MNENTENRSNERIYTIADRCTFWIGEAVDTDPVVMLACAERVPLIVVDSTDCDE